ncbi:hypothetical protein SAMD00019534_100390, partial [Acytostelium subglobosum LB1]|uniref:hypothetical protein n=1 Tax=Acytostelium subglobosum LB1 TaxID=1410327 RepID=UPI000644B790
WMDRLLLWIMLVMLTTGGCVMSFTHELDMEDVLDYENNVGPKVAIETDLDDEWSTNSGDQAQWFTQTVDHFSFHSDTFQQQYYVNDTFWDREMAGPIFLIIGGENPITSKYVTGQFVINDYAREHGALLLAIEHRFYGKSIPTPDLSTPNLDLLSSDQALADIANFRNYISFKYRAFTNKWIAFGGSYGGVLAAWTRLKYPYLVDASISSSAPVKVQANFAEYYESAATSLGAECASAIAQATTTIAAILQTSDRRVIESMFKTCSSIRTDDDITTFFEALASSVTEIVQYNNANNRYRRFNIDKMCSMIRNGEDRVRSFANYMQEYLRFSSKPCTTSNYLGLIDLLRNTSVNAKFIKARAWTWQTCNEFGFFGSTQQSNQLFSSMVTLPWYLKRCEDIFGPREDGEPYQPKVEWLNKKTFWTHSFFSNGLIDPWHSLGLLNSSSPLVMTYVMENSAHCADFFPPTTYDLEELSTSRRMQNDFIASTIARQRFPSLPTSKR